MGFEICECFEYQEDKQQWCFCGGDEGGKEACRDDDEVHREDPFIGLQVDLV